jgi:protein involved in polysaccharide export with SLBB domain
MLTVRATIAVAIMLVVGAIAGAASAAGPSGSAPPTGAVEVAAAERLAIRFQGYPELSGDYRIGADDAISVPVVGRIQVTGMTLPQLEQRLAARVGEITGKQNYVTVEVAVYKPVFVTGYVTRPGSIQWQPGMTVLQAVALSGGIYRPLQQGAATSNGGEAARNRMRKALDNQKRTLATLARLRAERDGVPVVEPSKELVDLIGETEARSLIDAQKIIFTSRKTALESQVAALDRARSLAGQELDALVAQKDRVEEQLRLRRDLRAKLQELLAKGIVRAERGMEEDIKVADLEEKSINTAVARARVQGMLAGLQREAILLKQDRQANIEKEISALEASAAQAALDVEGAEEEYRRITGESAQVNGKRVGPRISYSIIRTGKAGRETLAAQDQDALNPGDVLVVNQTTDVGDATDLRQLQQ